MSDSPAPPSLQHKASIFRQSDWLRAYIDQCLAHGLEFVGVEHEYFVPFSSIDQTIEELMACAEATLWVKISETGRRCPAQVIWQGPDHVYQQADEIVADFAGPDILDEIWQATLDKCRPALRERNPQWNGC